MSNLPAHSSVGGSTVGRLLGCTASLAMIAKVPETLRKEASVFADEGSALHELVARLLANAKLTPESFIGKMITIEGRTPITITEEHVADCVLPVLAFFNSEIGDIENYWLEVRSEFPGVDGAHGTADLFGIGPKRSVLVDWKMGAGVGVAATYPDDGDPAFETVNPQLMFYLCGLVALFPEALADGRTLDAYIVQPRHQDPAKRITVARNITRDELDQFIAQAKAAVAEARGPAPRRQRGDWCRFAACKAICPEHTGPLLDFSRLLSPVPPQLSDRADAEAYARTLAAGLALAETVEPLIREYRTQAHRLLEAGTPIYGWKLVPKRATRRWTDEALAAAALLTAGFDEADIFTLPELRSPAQVAKFGALPEHLIVKAASGTTLAHNDDARDAVPDRDETVRNLVRALQVLEAR